VTNWREFMFGGRSFIARIVGCRDCGFAFIDPYVDGTPFYTSAELDEYLSLTVQRRRFFAEVKKLTERQGVVLAGRPRILDVAAGGGDWLLQWPSESQRCATELHPRLVAHLQSEGVEVKSAPDEFEGDFDLISAFDFLEHLPDPRAWLASTWSRLRPGGYLILGVPDLGKRVARMLGTRYYLYCPMHYSYFNRGSLERLIAGVLASGAFIQPSPKMYGSLGAAIKWLSGGRVGSSILQAVRLPVGYSASLVAVIRRG
jgi:SAM-dependent methyltransferase